MKKLYITSILTVVLLAGCAPEGGVRLPAPAGLPAGPQGVDAPAASIVPLADRVDPQAPAIAAISPTAGPNDSLVVSGVDLDGARLRLWAGTGFPVEVAPLRSDDDQLVAVVPADLPLSTTLVWPVKSGRAGAPIRVNGPDLWWTYPAEVTSGPAATLRLFGRNFQLARSAEGKMTYAGAPRVAISGPGGAQRLRVTDSAHCAVEATLPAGLAPGRYWVWIHNGTGGRFGWSEPLTFMVVAPPERKDPVVVNAADFGATPDDGKDDTDALRRALDEVATRQHQSPVTLKLDAGTYHISRTLTTYEWAPFGGVTIEGVGMGGFDEDTLEPTGRHTTLAVTPGDYLPERMIEVVTPGATIRNLNLIMGGRQRSREFGLCLLAPRITVEKCRFVCLDRRPKNPKREPTLNQPPVFIDTPGKAHIEIRDCELYFPGPGIQIGSDAPGHYAKHGPPPSTDYIRISNCKFRGTYTGPLDASEEWLPPGIAGAHSRGVSNYNGKNVIVENSGFAGLDKAGGKILGRIVRCGNTSIRHQFFANNRATDIGPDASITGINHNLGELYLFHLMYPHGGLFDVTKATPETVTVSTPELRNASAAEGRALGVTGAAFSQIVDDVGTNDHWVLFICAGRGVGQYRVVDGMERGPSHAVFRVQKPWRVTPDATSRVVLTVVYRENIVFNNFTDAGASHNEKTMGVLFWYNAFDNLIADNTFRRTSGGVMICTLYRNPTGFNQVIGNTFESMTPWSYPMKNETTRPFVSDQFQVPGTGWAAPADRVWYSVGNTFRGNTGRGGAWAASYRHLFLDKETWPPPVPHPDGGMTMGVLEHNAFSGIPEGIRLTEPANWTVIRNNAIELTDPKAPVIEASKPELLDRVIGQ